MKNITNDEIKAYVAEHIKEKIASKQGLDEFITINDKTDMVTIDFRILQDLCLVDVKSRIIHLRNIFPKKDEN